MKTVIQIGLDTTCEYLFLANQKYAIPRPGSDKILPLLPDYFDTSGKWFYHGIDKNIKPLQIPTSSDHYQIYESLITSENTLEDFCNRNNIKHIDLLVMDIEGWEHKVIPTLKDCPQIDYLIVEYHWEKTFKFHIDRGELKAKEKFSVFMPTNRSEFISNIEKVNLHLEQAFPTNMGRTTEMWFKRYDPIYPNINKAVPLNDPELGYQQHLESEWQGVMGMPARTKEDRENI